MAKANEKPTFCTKEAEGILERLKQGRAPDSSELGTIVQVMEYTFVLLNVIKDTKITVHKLKRLIFGEKKNTKKSPTEEVSESKEPLPDAGKESSEQKTSSTPRKGHGRIPASQYTGAVSKYCEHGELKSGDKCPKCGKGSMYNLDDKVQIGIDGNPPLSAISYVLESFRCTACGYVTTAQLPPEHQNGKHTHTAKSTIAVLHYGAGMTFFGLEGFQSMMGIPLPDATQWDLCEQLGESVNPVFKHLVKLAAAGKLVYQDDTWVKILSQMKENESAKKGDRTGMYTTALVSVGDHKIALFFSGRKHAGDNLDDVLSHRPADMASIVKMSDSLNSNNTKIHKDSVIECNCNSHSLRKFRDIEGFYPAECGYVLDIFSDVYRNEHHTVTQKMTPAERLSYHQKYSKPLMIGVFEWIEQQKAQGLIEPNGSLGDVCKYMTRHRDKFMRFTEVEGAPIDNNEVERALKYIIKSRKNSLFYKNEHGAYIGSIITSIIVTCRYQDVNPVEYLTALQDNHEAVSKTPEMWLPWNYHDNLLQEYQSAA